MDVRHAPEAAGISRRSMLKRGALAGAAAVWAVPVVQAVSMTPAHADSPSGSTGGGGGNPTPVTTAPTEPSSSVASTSASRTETTTPAPSTSSSVGAESSHRVLTPTPTPVTSTGGGVTAAVDGVAAHRPKAGSLAATGPALPVGSTLLAGAAAIAVGAGVVAAAKPRQAPRHAGNAVDSTEDLPESE